MWQIIHSHSSQLHEQLTDKISDILEKRKPFVVIQHNLEALVVNEGKMPGIAQLVVGSIQLLKVYHYLFFCCFHHRAVNVASGTSRAHLEHPGAQQIRVGAVGRSVGAHGADSQKHQQQDGAQGVGPGTHADGARGADGRESKFNWNTTRWQSGDPSGSRLKIPKSPETQGPRGGVTGW